MWYKKRGRAEDISREGGCRGTTYDGEFKKCEGKESDPETVMFVPSTPRGELVKN